MIDVRVDSGRPYQALVTLRGGEKDLPCRVSFLDEDVVRVTVDPAGAFAQYATPRSPEHAARIVAQPDESDVYAHPSACVRDEGATLAVCAGDTEVLVDKDDGRLTLRRRGRIVMREAAPLELGPRRSTQELTAAPGERFFGGGTQNGRVEHAGSVVRIVTTLVERGLRRSEEHVLPRPVRLCELRRRGRPGS